MQLIRIRFMVPPEKHGDALNILKLSQGPTRVMSGCQTFNYYQSLEDGNIILLEQIWESIEALKTYLCSNDFTKILLATEMAIEKPFIEIHEVLKTSGMEFIQRARQTFKQRKIISPK